MITYHQTTRAARPLLAAALLALTTGCATSEKSSSGQAVRSGGAESVVDLNQPGPHQAPSVLVVTTADNLSPQSRLAHKKHQVRVRFRIESDPRDPTHVVVTHAVENAD